MDLPLSHLCDDNDYDYDYNNDDEFSCTGILFKICLSNIEYSVSFLFYFFVNKRNIIYVKCFILSRFKKRTLLLLFVFSSLV